MSKYELIGWGVPHETEVSVRIIVLHQRYGEFIDNLAFRSFAWRRFPLLHGGKDGRREVTVWSEQVRSRVEHNRDAVPTSPIRPSISAHNPTGSRRTNDIIPIAIATTTIELNKINTQTHGKLHKLGNTDSKYQSISTSSSTFTPSLRDFSNSRLLAAYLLG